METLAALLGGGGLIAVTTFGLLALLAERRAGKAETRAAVTAKDNETLKATCAERAAALVEKEKTIRALNIAIAETAADAAPVDGSMQRLLQAVAKIHAANGNPSVVSDTGGEGGEAESVDRAGDSELLKPGE